MVTGRQKGVVGTLTNWRDPDPMKGASSRIASLV